jgi:hypothetical protein
VDNQLPSLRDLATRGRAIIPAFIIVILTIWLTSESIRTLDPANVDLTGSFVRCHIDAGENFDFDGSIYVDRCELSKVDLIDLGEGRCLFEDGSILSGQKIVLRPVPNRALYGITLTGNDLAIGDLTQPFGRWDIQYSNETDLGIGYFPLMTSGQATGNLSLGDSCIIGVEQYELFIDDTPYPIDSDCRFEFHYYPIFGSALFSDAKGGYDITLSPVDPTVDFESPMAISAISFVDLGNQCAGFIDGFIELNHNTVEHPIRFNKCVTLVSEEPIKIRHFRADRELACLSIDLSCQVEELELGHEQLTSKPYLEVGVIGLIMLLASAALTFLSSFLLNSPYPMRRNQQQH